MPFVILCALVQGCKEDNSVSPYDYDSIWKCHQKSTWNLESTENKIIGRWEWKYVRCCGKIANPYESATEFKGLEIEFKADGTGILNDNDAPQEFTWTIGTYDVVYGITTDPPISQLGGQILFCDDIMMCNASLADGADNFFGKLQ